MKPSSTTRRLSILGLLAAVALLVSACGDDDGSTSTEADSAATTEQTTTEAEAPQARAGDRDVAVTADPSGGLAYLEGDLEAKAGKLTVSFENPADVIHDVVIEQDGKVVAESERVTAGTTSFDVKLDPGTYTYFCSLTGHRAAGMEGTLRVE